MMENYSQYIHPIRRSIPTPKSLVDEKGQCHFGTFIEEFEAFHLLQAKRPTRLPQWMNRFKLTLWQATEIHLSQGILVCGLADMGITGMIYHVFYHKASKTVTSWHSPLPSNKVQFPKNLIQGSQGYAHSKRAAIECINHFEMGKCSLQGKSQNKESTIEYHFELDRLSLPSVVSIPLGKNRPLYSQKDFLKAKGYLIFNGEKMQTDAFTTAIVDDHRGYYPRRSHYDWLSSMGHYNTGGKEQYFAFNLTRNQSSNQEKYNENLIWFENKTSILPPVTFSQSIKSIDYKSNALWTVKDKHDMVNLRFYVEGISPMIFHSPLVKIDYFFAFGRLEGYLRDEEGRQYVLNGVTAMGEDKSLLL